MRIKHLCFLVPLQAVLGLCVAPPFVLPRCMHLLHFLFYQSVTGQDLEYYSTGLSVLPLFSYYQWLFCITLRSIYILNAGKHDQIAWITLWWLERQITNCMKDSKCYCFLCYDLFALAPKLKKDHIHSAIPWSRKLGYYCDFFFMLVKHAKKWGTNYESDAHRVTSSTQSYATMQWSGLNTVDGCGIVTTSNKANLRFAQALWVTWSSMMATCHLRRSPVVNKKSR